MSLAETAARMEARLERIKNDERKTSDRLMEVGGFMVGVGASSGYRAWLNKNNKAMPKLLGIDADTVLGVVLVGAGFFEAIPSRYAPHAVTVGAGLLSGSVGNKIAGYVNEKVATKGEFVAGHDYARMGSGEDVSAHRGATILEMIRNAGLQRFRRV
jgi:hypothetical protein